MRIVPGYNGGSEPVSANRLKPSERMKIPRQLPLEQAPGERNVNFLEVSFGFDEERSVIEASRCIECKKATCVDGCPVSIDIPSFIQLVLQKDYVGAVNKIREANYLPAICGRVCPQESQCEELCVLGKKLTPVAIGKLERFVADFEMRHDLFIAPVIKEKRKEKVAIVGSGPAGLTCAAELAKLGYQVTVFEALHAVGGVLRYGIPEFRLPKEILDLETDRIKALGVETFSPDMELPANGAPAGATATLAVRPEALRLSLAPLNPAAPNLLAGEVVEVIYEGGSRRWVIALSGGGRIVARDANSPGGGAGPIGTGQNVYVCWDPGRSLIFTD